MTKKLPPTKPSRPRRSKFGFVNPGKDSLRKTPYYRPHKKVVVSLAKINLPAES